MIRVSLALITLLLYSTCLGLSPALTVFLLPPLLLIAWWYTGTWKHFFIKLLFLNIFIIMIVISLLFAHKTEHALLVFLRSNAIIAMALFLFHDKDAFAIAFGIQRLRVPKKLSALFFFTAKFIVLIKEEFATFRHTLKIRGFKATTSLFTYKTYANFIGMLIIKALRRATRTQHAMLLRGFNGELYSLHQSTIISKQEYLFLLVLCASLLFHLGALL